MAVAAALNGKLTDVRKYGIRGSDTANGNKFSGAADLKVTSGLDFVHEIAPPSPPLSEKSAILTEPTIANPVSARVAKFTLLKGIAAPLEIENIDTDMIIAVPFLKGLKRTGLGVHLFHALRVDPHTGAKTDFVLNRAPYDKAHILVCTGSNFGCGSSREHAPWSL